MVEPAHTSITPGSDEPDPLGMQALARWVATGGQSAAHRFALQRFWALKLGIVAGAIDYRPWDVIRYGDRDPKLVAPVFKLDRINPSSPSLSFLAAIPKVERYCLVEIDELGNFWFRTARLAYLTMHQEARERARTRQPNSSGCLPGLNVYHDAVQGLTKSVPANLQDDWQSLKNLAPANALADKARRATSLLILTSFERSVFGSDGEAEAFLRDDESYVEAVFAALKQK